MDAPQHIRLIVPAQLTQKSDGSSLGCLDIEFVWTASDPYALTMVFKEAGEDVDWHAAVDLFINALIDVAHGWHGEGDISVRLYENVCCVDLHGDHERPAVIAEMSAIGLAPFINRISRLRIVHADYISWLINKELDEMLEAA